jgi:hypothetical protein
MKQQVHQGRLTKRAGPSMFEGFTVLVYKIGIQIYRITDGMHDWLTTDYKAYFEDTLEELEEW